MVIYTQHSWEVGSWFILYLWSPLLQAWGLTQRKSKRSQLSSIAKHIPRLWHGSNLVVSSEISLMLKQLAELQPKYLKKKYSLRNFSLGACFILHINLASECRKGWELVIFWGLCRARSLLNTAIILSSLVQIMSISKRELLFLFYISRAPRALSMLSKSNSLLGVGLPSKVLFCFTNEGRTAVYSKKGKCARTISQLVACGARRQGRKAIKKALLG